MAGKSKGKGGKNRRRGKKLNLDRRELQLKEEFQEYAQVLKMLGNGRVECLCYDGEQRLCHIRGKMRKKVWIMVGDIVLISLRDFQDERADIIYKYLPDEARQLKHLKEIPDSVQVNEDEEENGADIQFGDVEDSMDSASEVEDIAVPVAKYTGLAMPSDDEYEYDEE